MRKLTTSELGRPEPKTAIQLPKAPIIVILDNVRSALNVGSFFRTCDAFGVEALFLCGISATPPHKEIQKTAIGATESVEWKYFQDTLDAIQVLKDREYHIMGVEQTDMSVELMQVDVSLHRRIALIFGNEVDGISEAVIQELDTAIEIHQWGAKHSLNVAVCGGVVIHHLARQFFLS